MFDLEKAIASWRRRYEGERSMLPEDLRELEQHLREHIAELLGEGVSAREAFFRARGEFGEEEEMRAAYRRVFWGKARRHRTLRDHLVGEAAMLKNYFKTALRGLLRHKGYAFLNAAGLALGLACAILILLFVQHELSYDRFHEKADRIYRVIQRQPANVFLGSDRFALTPASLAPDLVEAFPEVTRATSLGPQEALLSVGDRHHWGKGLWADAQFFDVFTFAMLRGRPETALAEPNSIVLTETLARSIFGEEDPVGRTLLFENRETYVVTGVVADVPETSHFTFEFLIAIQANARYAQSLAEGGWRQNEWLTYVVLAEGADAGTLQEKLRAFVDRRRYADKPDEPEENRVRLHLQRLTDIHLHSHVNFEIGANGDIRYVYLFAAVGFVILLLACVNYTNLAIARSIKRSREVGLRKVVGARRRQLVGQFLGESVLMALVALALALVLVHLLLPAFGHLVERPLGLDYAGNGLLLPGLLALVVLVGLLSGSYPAVFMASLRPLQVLAGKTEGRASRFRVQRLLIVGQYAVSIALVAGSFVIQEQLQYVQRKDPGYDREHVVVVRVRDRSATENYPSIRAEWLRNPHVVAVSSSRNLPTNIESSTGISGWEGSSEQDQLRIYQTEVDYDFLDVFGIELAAGRAFSRQHSTDLLEAVVINETAARALGWTPEEAIGKHFLRSGAGTESTVVGVVKDFHMHSMHTPIEPLLIYLEPEHMWYISARVDAEDLPGTIVSLERAVKRFSPYPFEYQFLDEHFDQLYRAERRLGETFGFFTVLALLIASLGLFSLAAFAAEQRTKEIGIRKVLGANVSGLVALLSKEYLKLVAAAFVVGAPLAYFAAQRWLEAFAYRIELGLGVFLLAGVSALGIALATVSFQAVKAALEDPVKSLRYE